MGSFFCCWVFFLFVCSLKAWRLEFLFNGAESIFHRHLIYPAWFLRLHKKIQTLFFTGSSRTFSFRETLKQHKGKRVSFRLSVPQFGKLNSLGTFAVHIRRKYKTVSFPVTILQQCDVTVCDLKLPQDFLCFFLPEIYQAELGRTKL